MDNSGQSAAGEVPGRRAPSATCRIPSGALSFTSMTVPTRAHRTTPGIAHIGRGGARLGRTEKSAPSAGILDVSTHEAIVAELNKPERGRGRPAGSRWLLSGFTVCGRCGQPMMAGGHRKVKAKGGANRAQRYYRCARLRNKTTGCGATMVADAIEAWVEERVLDTVSPARWQQLRSRRTAL